MKKQIGLLAVIGLMFLGGCSGGDPAPTPVPPTPTVNPPGAVTLSAPEKNKVCEPGTVISDTQREVSFSWTASANTESYDMAITNLDCEYISDNLSSKAGSWTFLNPLAFHPSGLLPNMCKSKQSCMVFKSSNLSGL